MFKNIKQTLKHTSIFALGKVSTKLVGFILLPIYTREISVSDYGVLGLLEVLDLLGSNVLSIGMPQALLRWHSLTEKESERKSIVFTNFTFLGFIFIATIFLIFPFRASISNLIFNSPQYGIFIIYVLISITFANLARIAQSLLRIEEKSMLYALSVIAQFSASLILNIYFVAFLKLGVKGILIANIISQALLFTILFPYLIKRMEFRIDFQKLREMLGFSYPFIFIALSTTILSLGDRLILEKLSSRAQVGLYSLGYKISNVLKILIVDAFTLSLPIIGWKLVKDDSKPKEYFSKILTYLTFTLLWLGLIIGIFSQKIIQVFAKNPEYWEAYRVIPLLLLGVVFLGIQQLLFFILQIPKKTKHISIIIGIAALSNILINLILIPKYHMMGAAYTTVISFVLAAVLAYLAVQKYYPIQVEHRKIFTLFILTTLLFWGATSVTGMANSYQFMVKISAVVLYPIVLYPLKFYSIDEKRKMKEILFRFFGRQRPTE